MLYRIFWQRWNLIAVHGNSGGWPNSDGFKPTRLTVKARSEKEAMRKANQLWQKGEFGTGSIIVKPA